MEDLGHGVRLVYEDNHLVVVDKPAGLLSQGDATGDVCVVDVVAEWRRVAKQKPGAAWVGLIHRLDRPVRGLLLLALTSKAAERLSAAVRERRVDKRYRALVVGQPRLGRYEGVVDERPAALTVERSEPVGAGFSRVELSLETGRKHQIRVQLSEAGHPIVGDVRHGGPAWSHPRAIALCAWRLGFEHPTRREPLTFELEGVDWWLRPGGRGP